MNHDPTYADLQLPIKADLLCLLLCSYRKIHACDRKAYRPRQICLCAARSVQRNLLHRNCSCKIYENLWNGISFKNCLIKTERERERKREKERERTCVEVTSFASPSTLYHPPDNSPLKARDASRSLCEGCLKGARGAYARTRTHVRKLTAVVDSPHGVRSLLSFGMRPYRFYRPASDGRTDAD